MKTTARLGRALAQACVRGARGWPSLAAIVAWGISGLGAPIAEAIEMATPGHVLNISTRGRIGTGDEVLIAGFVIVGESPRRVLVRVLGPSLAQFGVNDAIADPEFDVIPPNSSTVLARNDNWGDGDPDAVRATGFPPFDPHDCALVLDLGPGLYTAVVRGVGGCTGVGLVEVFDLDHPRVSATSPAKYVEGVSATSASVVVTFDRPMAPEVDMEPCVAWGASNYAWSADRRRLTISRISAASRLAAASRMTITLNPTAGTHRMRDMEGNLLPTYTVLFTTGVESGAPYVVSTVPETGGTVRPDLQDIVFTFSEPMYRSSGGTSMGWWPYVCTWSTDARTMHVTRTGTEPLPPGQTIMFRIDPPNYRSAAGVSLAGSSEVRVSVGLDQQRIEADPAHGFHWPYYLVLPPSVSAPATLLVEPNNTGTWGDNPAVHETAAEALARNRAGFAATLGCPLLVPAFPRPQNPPAPESGGIYTHALDRFCLQMTGCPIERLDLQLLAMVEDARTRLAAQGVDCDPKFFMAGFSASGAFTSRFSLLHPDSLKAAACGSPGGWPIAPVASWNGTALPYPCGISDVTSLVGTAPDVPVFAALPLFIYVGSVDTNDAYDLRGMASAERTAIMALLNAPQDPYIANRWPTAQAIYQSVGSVATFRVYPGVGHSYSTEIINDLTAFFAAHR